MVMQRRPNATPLPPADPQTEFNYNEKAPDPSGALLYADPNLDRDAARALTVACPICFAAVDTPCDIAADLGGFHLVRCTIAKGDG